VPVIPDPSSSDFTYVLLTGRYQNDDGSAQAGTFTFRLSEPIVNDSTVHAPTEIVATLDGGGNLAVTLAANDDPATLPIGTFYSVTENITGAPPRDYEIRVPSAAVSGTCSIESLAPTAVAGDTGGSNRYATYIDLTEAKDWLRFVAGSPTTYDSNLQRIIDMACTQIQTHIGRPVAPLTVVERHDGWSGEYIMLSQSPFLSLNYCHEWQSSGGLVNLPESTPANPVDGIQIDYSTGRLMRTFAGYSWPRPFFPGSRNIEVSYVAGFNPIPPDIWMATVELIAHWWNMSQVGRGSARGQQSGEDATDGLWQGMPNRIVNLINPYRMIAIG
jgi:hypothetical protein